MDNHGILDLYLDLYLFNYAIFFLSFEERMSPLSNRDKLKYSVKRGEPFLRFVHSIDSIEIDRTKHRRLFNNSSQQ